MPKSQMPKGVEHDPANRRRKQDPQMPKSQMPKGVEHRLDEEILRLAVACRNLRCRKALSTRFAGRFGGRFSNAEISDAERR